MDALIKIKPNFHISIRPLIRSILITAKRDYCKNHLIFFHTLTSKIKFLLLLALIIHFTHQQAFNNPGGKIKRFVIQEKTMLPQGKSFLKTIQGIKEVIVEKSWKEIGIYNKIIFQLKIMVEIAEHRMQWKKKLHQSKEWKIFLRIELLVFEKIHWDFQVILIGDKNKLD